MNDYLIYGLGFLAQSLFFFRTITQWFKSEKVGAVISPSIFWKLSLLASAIMFLYGILRKDFAIILGQYIVYFIYIRNLQLKNAWKKFLLVARIIILLIPFIYLSWLLFGNSHNFKTIFGNENVTVLLMLWGSAGQIIFTFRFVYQWIYSENKKESVLPLGFWLISTLGSLMIFVYSIFRLDPVLFASHSLALFIYIRNILLYFGKKGLPLHINIPIINKISDKVSEKIK